jgi:uncharacterized protein (TIGR01777 family)
MHIFITGATGFIGRALVLRLQRDGHTITAWVRDEDRASAVLGADVEFLYVSASEGELRDALAVSDGVVNLAGEPLIGRWTRQRMQTITESRVDLTARLVQAMRHAEHRPPVFVSASAVGYYGDRGDEVLTERSSPADDFLARLCRDWERAALAAESSGARVVLLRTGIVLGREGGALARLLLPFKLGLGGPIGSGRQYMPWIHLHDHVELVVAALGDDRFSGPFNLSAPAPVTNRDFARALAQALHRPALLPVPAFALKLALGEASSVLLAGQRAIPERALDLDFHFAYQEIDAALSEIVGQSAPVEIRRLESA